MVEIHEATSDADAARLSRRTALKAGVAAGVGVAVWGGPQIGRIGSQPAYAAHCTPGTFDDVFSTDKKNTNMSCGAPNGNPAFKCVEYFAVSQKLVVDGKNVTFDVIDSGGKSGLCSNSITSRTDPPDGDGEVVFTLTGVPAGTTCVPLIRVFEQGGGNQTFTIVGTATTLPEICDPPLSITGSIFLSYGLRCGPTACFH